MSTIATRIIGGLVAAILLVVAALYVLQVGPFKGPVAAIVKEQRKDAAAATKIEDKGAKAVAQDVSAAATTQAKAQKQVEYVTRTVRLSPTAASPLPADRIDRLRAADRELCKLGVECGGQGSGAQPSGPATAADAGIGAGRVPALRPVG